jgi:hypothetical protein
MRCVFVRLPVQRLAGALVLSIAGSLAGCSSDATGGGPVDPGAITLEGVSAKHGVSVLRFTATVKNTTRKSIKSLDSIEVDTGGGAKRAATIRACDPAQISPWLVKAGASATIEFTLRSNGPDRQAVEAACVDASGNPEGPTSLWEFQTFTVLETNGSDPVKLAMNGTLDDGAVWSAVGSTP